MMASGPPPPVVRGQCCMLCYGPLYGTGISIYHTRSYQAEKSLYAKLMEVTNYTASIPQLVSDMMCSLCFTMISQADQLGNQLSHVTTHIRALFHKMVQVQTEAVRLNREAQEGAAAVQAGVPTSQARAITNGAGGSQPGLGIPAGHKPQTSTAEQSVPTNLQIFKKPSDERVPEAPQRHPWPSSGSETESGDSGALQVNTSASSAGSHGDENSFLNLGAFLQTSIRGDASGGGGGGGGERPSRPMAPAPEVTQTGDFTDKFVQGLASSDVYRYQCVLCSKLGDCEEAVRRHVRADHPGADRISFSPPDQPAAAGAGQGQKRKASGAPKPPKALRTITATAPAMAQNIADRLYVCVNCDKAFGCEAFLTRHVEAQKCGVLFGCQFCGKEFTRSDKKVRHERSHTGERPFSCDYCGKTFSRRDKCTKHERTHVRCQPLECHSCGEVMSTTSEYTAHRRHCGERAAAAAAAARAAAAAGTGTMSLSNSAWPQPLPQAPQQPPQPAASDV